MANQITAWRIVKASYAGDAFSGEGARRYGGRWNEAGTAVAYTAESRALAALELLVHLDGPARLGLFVLIPVTFSESLVERIPQADLPLSWNRPVPSPETAAFGSAWAAEMRSAVLRVPSAIVAEEWNYVLNVRHPAFSNVEIGSPQSFVFDARL